MAKRTRIARIKANKTAAKSKNKGTDGIVSSGAARTKYSRAIKRGKDVNGNPVPKLTSTKDKIEWARGVEKTKAAKVKATGAERTAKSRAKATGDAVKDQYIKENQAQMKLTQKKLDARVAALGSYNKNDKFVKIYEKKLYELNLNQRAAAATDFKNLSTNELKSLKDVKAGREFANIVQAKKRAGDYAATPKGKSERAKARTTKAPRGRVDTDFSTADQSKLRQLAEAGHAKGYSVKGGKTEAKISQAAERFGGGDQQKFYNTFTRVRTLSDRLRNRNLSTEERSRLQKQLKDVKAKRAEMYKKLDAKKRRS